MKKLLLLLTIVGIQQAYAQIPEDAIRYSWYPHNGTARNMATGGVMGSLGGDLTALYVNPAGIGFFRTGEIVLTPGFRLNNNQLNFRENPSEDKKNLFGFGPSGYIQGYTRRHEPKNSYAFAIGINQTASFNNYYHYGALNNYRSFSEQFAEEFAKSGQSIDNVLNTQSVMPYTAAPALYTYLIDTVTVNGIRQVRGAPERILDAGGALRQDITKRTRGGIYEISAGYAENMGDKWFWGASLGIPIVYYNSHTVLTESDTSANRLNGFNTATYTDDFKTTGAGINIRLGGIYRPSEHIRLGLAIQTPTFMFLNDKHNSYLYAQIENDTGKLITNEVSSNLFTNGSPGENRYYQNAPWKAVISASYVFREVENVKRQRAFISADIEYVNHRGSRFNSYAEEPTEDEKNYYKALNRVVRDEFKGTFNFRLGGEIKFNTIMARLGAAYYGNPYKDKDLKANRLLLSGGLGYRNKGFFIDLTYVHQVSKDVNFPYRLEDRANTFATIKQTQGNLVASVGFKF